VPTDERIAVAGFAGIEIAPSIVMKNHVINPAALQRCIERYSRQMPDIALIESVMARHDAGATPLPPVHDDTSSSASAMA
jgi:hypothetical protein